MAQNDFRRIALARGLLPKKVPESGPAWPGESAAVRRETEDGTSPAEAQVRSECRRAPGQPA